MTRNVSEPPFTVCITKSALGRKLTSASVQRTPVHHSAGPSPISLAPSSALAPGFQ